ncbi:E3 ubiquitin-protein ligase MBR1-like [Malania oleifera]|uniref:E3 ubiquitin-protein ligase MBR1-like n=1 Tax=Malania oleifera TaxID=397392 RepID=UPI0025AEC773|nr:E3 ubiquitin-protein ligase MBR1-like [Malania oleifera]
MDEISRKRSVGGLPVSRKGSSLVLRDTADNRDQNAQFCNRLGCSGRLKSMRSTQSGYLEKPKSQRPLFRSSSNGKEIIGSSSRTCSMVSNSRKYFLASRKKTPSQMETDSSESSSVQDESDALELSPSGKIETGLPPQLLDADSGDVTLMEVGSSSVTSNTRPRKNIHQKSRLGNQETTIGSSVSLASRSTPQGGRYGANASRYNLRNLRCNSISDVIPPGFSSSETSLSRGKDTLKKINPEGGSSSSAKGKKISGLSSLEEKRISSSSHGISISDSRRPRNWLPSNRDNNIGSVRTRRSINDNARVRLSNPRNLNNLSSTVSPVVIPHGIAGSANAPSLSHQFSAESSATQPNSCSQPSSRSENVRNIMSFGPAEVGFTRTSMNRDAMHHYSMDGIAEVLLALERIEQDEITYEQLLILQTNLFLNGLAFHDQHRDLRLDIENMSYEELLDLEERMGTVSTALSEEALSKCLRRSIYQCASPETEVIGCSGDYDDIKCSICQEEYSDGDEVGRLQCEHRFHVVCIQQWLQLKNWCPICKASAATSA